MKITQIMLSRGFGGAERHFVELSIALADLGHEIQVIHHKKFFGKDSFKGLPIKTEVVNVRGYWDVLGAARIRSLINKFAPDLVHAHLARAALMAGKVCQKSNIPLVVKTHNYINLKYYQQVTRFITTTSDQKKYLQASNISKDRIPQPALKRHSWKAVSSPPPACPLIWRARRRLRQASRFT